ncbi:MAG: hypothetical protein AAGB34_07625 [Planctomycetota bacterium]
MKGRPRLKFALQVIGFAVGIGLFVFALTLALKPENREAIGHLREASQGEVVLFFTLIVANIILNGFIFWWTHCPLRGRDSALRHWDVQAVNAIATFLAVLPFKLSIAMRFLVHIRRDKMKATEIVSWFAAMTALTAAVLLPAAGASLLLKRIDALWITAVVVGIALCLGLGIWISLLAERVKVIRYISFGAYKVTSHWRTSLGHAMLRVIDVGLLTVRVALVASVAGFTLGISGAILVGTTFFVMGIIAPSGQLGAREGGTMGVAALAGLEINQIALITTLLTATETMTSLVISAPSAWHLRLHRLIGKRTESKAPSQSAGTE